MYSNSIYKTLRQTTTDSKKLGIAYVHALMKGKRNNYSKDPLVDEGMNVYIGLDTMGINTLEHFEEIYINEIKSHIDDNGYSPIEGTVAEVVLKILKKGDVEEGLERIGNSLKNLVIQRKPSLARNIEDITAGYIQREEQKAIKTELSQYLK